MTKKLLFMLIALAALVVPDIGVAKSITFQAEDFVNSDGGNYTSAGLYGDTYQVSATKHNISLRCCFDFVGTYYGGPYLGFDPHYGFISVEDMPEGISVTAVEINFGNIDYLPSNKLSLWTSDGKPNYVSSIATFPVVTANNTLTQNKDVFADYVSNGTSRIEVPAANYFFIAQYNDKYGDPVKINSVTIEYSESSSLAPEILFSTPPNSLTINESESYFVAILHGEGELTYAVTSSDSDPSNVTITDSGEGSYTFSASTPGNYTVTYTATVDGVVISNSFDVEVTEKPATTPIKFYDGVAGSIVLEKITFDELEKTHYFHTSPYFTSNYIVSIVPDNGGITVGYDDTKRRWEVKSVHAGEYTVGISTTIDGVDYFGEFEVEVKEKIELEEIEFSNTPAIMTIPADQDSETATFTVSPQSSDYEIFVTQNNWATAGLSCVANGSGEYLLTANEEGFYLVKFSNATHEGSFTVTVKKDTQLPTVITFSDEEGPLSYMELEVEEGKAFTVNPSTGLTNLSWTQDPAYSIAGTYPNYTITAISDGQFNIAFTATSINGTSVNGSLPVTITKESINPVTFSEVPSALTIGVEETSVSAKFLVDPEADDYNWTVTENGETTSFVTVAKNSDGQGYILTAFAPGDYTVTARKEGYYGTFNLTVTKEQPANYSPITFYDGNGTFAPIMTSKVVDLDDLNDEEKGHNGRYDFAIWPNLLPNNDPNKPNVPNVPDDPNRNLFKATVTTIDGTVVDSEVMEVSHGGNTIHVTPKKTGEYIIHLEGQNSFNPEELCAGELKLKVTGTELSVVPLPDEIRVGDIVNLTILPEEGNYTVTSSDTYETYIRLIEEDGKFSFKALKEGGPVKLTVTRTVEQEDGSTKTRKVELSFTVLNSISASVFVSNPRQTYEPSEEPYSIWIDHEPVGYCKVKVVPKGDSPADGIRIDLGDTGKEYLLYAKKEGTYDLIFSGNVLSVDGNGLTKIDDSAPQYTVTVQKDEIEYNLELTIVDKDGNEIDYDEFPMDETIYFTANPKSTSANGYHTSYYPSNAICTYDDATGIYSFDGLVEDLYSIFVYDEYKTPVLNENLQASTYKGKLNVTVLQSNASVLEFEEEIPARIKINEPLTLTIADNKYKVLKQDETAKIEATENGESVTCFDFDGKTQTCILTGNKVGNYRVTIKATTFDGIEMYKSFRIAVVPDGTQDVYFVGAEG